MLDKELIIACLKGTIELAQNDLECFTGECTENTKLCKTTILKIEEQIRILKELE